MNIHKIVKLWSGAAGALLLTAFVVSCKGNVTTPIAVTGVTLDKPTVSLVAGTNTTLIATVVPANAANKKVTWSSDKPEIASVDAKGTVTAHKAGAAVITVETDEGAKTASCKVTVTAKAAVAVTEVTLNKSKLRLEEGKSEQLTATVAPANATNKTVTWSSNKPDVAAVDKDGKVTAHKVGEATITVTTTDGGKAASCTVRVLTRYTITYNLNGGTNGKDNPAHYTVETETITLKPANKADHIFFGWYVSADFSGEKVTQITKGNSGNKELYAKFIEMKMIDIAAVTSGNLGHADYSSSHNDVHTVSLTAYRIGESEVTQELWQAVMGNNPSEFKSRPDGSEVQEKRPVESVNWYECIAFCNELTKQAGLGESQCVYSVEGHIYGTADAVARKVPEMDMNKKGFRLPTEAEWEWAAKGGKDDKWAGTNDKNKLKEYAWYKDDDGGDANDKTHEVKKKQANGYGLYDMSGNVWEWCWDLHTYTTPTGGQDPTGAASSSYGSPRVTRGGSWILYARLCVVGFRSNVFPDNSYDNLGFRLVCRP